MNHSSFSPRSWSARRCPADRVGAARSAMRGHRASAATHAVGRTASPFGSRPGARPRRASTRAERTMRASTVFPDTLFGPLLADRTPGRDADRGLGEKCGLVSRSGSLYRPNTSWPGLSRPSTLTHSDGSERERWMPGTSPGMTTFGRGMVGGTVRRLPYANKRRERHTEPRAQPTNFVKVRSQFVPRIPATSSSP